MSAVAVEEPRLLHALPGRVRIHVPGPVGQAPRDLAAHMRRVAGVRSVEANPLTGNILVRFDPAATDAAALLAASREGAAGAGGADGPAPAPARPRHSDVSPVIRDAREGRGRARIAVPGLDRNPGVARAIVERISGRPGVLRVVASPLTGRVLVEFAAHQVDIEDLLAQIAGLDLPDLPDEDRPAHPLDPQPLYRSAGRTVGAGLGLGLLAMRQVFGQAGPPVAGAAPAQVAATITLLRSFPATRDGLRSLLGYNLTEVLFQGAAIVSLALAGSPLGLAVSLAEGVRLLTEILARRRAWRQYVERLGAAAAPTPGATVRLESGDLMPLAGTIVEGFGTASGPDGLPLPAAPGAALPAGARLRGGSFVVALGDGVSFAPEPRPAPPAPALYERYVRATGFLALGYAALTALFTRSLARTFAALLLVNPRTAVIGMEAANTGASARALRAGVTVVGTRPERIVRRPDLLLVGGPRVLADGFEIAHVLPLDSHDSAGLLALATELSVAAAMPWGNAFATTGREPATAGSFDGRTATARIDGVRYCLGPVRPRERIPAAMRLQHRGEHLLALRREGVAGPLGLFVLRPRLAPGGAELVAACAQYGVALAVHSAGAPLAARELARRARLDVLDGDAVATIRARQAAGQIVAFLGDSAADGPAFAACDLAIGYTTGRHGSFPARADLLAPDLGAVAAIVEAGGRREAAVRDAVGLSALANVAGIAWGARGAPGIAAASNAVNITALGALAAGWSRLRGGARGGVALARFSDPRPERWGHRPVGEVLRELGTTAEGLTTAQATARLAPVAPRERRNATLLAILDQLRSPITGILALGAGFSIALGSFADVAFIGAMIAVNAAVGAWQEYQAGRAAEALARMGGASARVLRDGLPVVIPADGVVPGDVLVLAPGDHVVADARVIAAQGLEVDEAALTGESLPVGKVPEGGTDAGRIVLDGSDVTVGTGRAVVVAVGRQTRLGVTAAALADDETSQSPLGLRLSRLLRQFLPLAVGGGGVVLGAGLLRGLPPGPQLALGASVAIAAVPEGLPLLAGIGEAAVARRLAGRRALVRRLAAIEALGRVDIACADKTGTLTEGRLAVRHVADLAAEALLPGPLPPPLREVLLVGALASPHPDAPDAAAHPTDVAVARAAEAVGLGDALRASRVAEASFDPVRSFHAALVDSHLCVKGATEALIARCDRARVGAEERPLDAAGRAAWLRRAHVLAERGLRVLLVARGPAEARPDDPRGLVALGFLGISDPLRPEVRAAVRRCREAGVRVIMLTGDHPATARTIAREAGLLDGAVAREILTGDDIADLANGELDERIERAAVIARITPLDKLRIVESLQRRGHTVAMTGDGINDAPSLRLADVGVAMGAGGTEVARQAADVVLADDNFATLVDALLEGRSFWRNIRRALGLLLGGNLGELGLIVGASVLGTAMPLTARQILAVNLITDALPALAVALQPPEHRHLAGLTREGTAALDVTLRRDVLRRGAATALPALAAYLAALALAGPAQAAAVAFGGIVATQLAQTLDAGWAEGGLNWAVVGAVGISAGILVALTATPLRAVLGLAAPAPLTWGLIGAAALAAVALSRGLNLPLPSVPRLSLPATVPVAAPT